MDTKYGIISDIHQAHPLLVDLAIKVLIQEGAQQLVLNGDLVGDKFPDSTLDEQNYAAIVLQLAGRSGLETYVLEGSHECVPLFQPVIETLSKKYSNLVDCMKNPTIKCENHDLVFLAGSDWHAGNAVQAGGYHLLSGNNNTGLKTGLYRNSKINGTMVVRNMNDLRHLVTNPETTIVFSHIPPKFDNLNKGIDMAYFAQKMNGSLMPGVVLECRLRRQLGNVPDAVIEQAAAQEGFTFKRENRGNEDLRKMYKEIGITKNVTGHFHESVHRAHDRNAIPVAEGEFTTKLFWNASYLDQGKIGILTVNENKAAYRNINIHNYIC